MFCLGNIALKKIKTLRERKRDRIMIKIAQIGCGHWGPNLLRNFYNLDIVEVRYLAEKSLERRKYVKSNYKDIEVIEDYAEFF